jgi:alkylation response protein AidB-like acyl-CoA dehydrogenase
MANQTVSDLLGAVERIAPLIAQHAAAAEADRHLSDAVYHAMYEAGLYAMLAPKAHGGLELHPSDSLRIWEAVARIDAAAARNLVMNQAIAAYAAGAYSQKSDNLPSGKSAQVGICGTNSSAIFFSSFIASESGGGGMSVVFLPGIL